MRYIIYLDKVLHPGMYNEIDEGILTLMNLQEFFRYTQNGITKKICYLKNNIDFTTLTKYYLDFFEFKELSSKEMADLIDSINLRCKTVINNDGSVSMIEYKKYFELYPDPKPFVDAQWDQKRNVWKYIPEELNSIQYNCSWNEQKQKNIYEKIIAPERNKRAFGLWKVQEKQNNATFNDACTSKKYNITSLETITHSTNKFESMIVDSQSKYKKILNHSKILDIEPLACITYQEFSDEDIQNFIDIMKIHPQCVCRTIQELFRLIIEWAYAHTHLNNEEPTAKLCHNLLRAVQMPLDVRNEIIDKIPAQPVARFLKNDTNALEQEIEDPPMPEKFKEWISDTYRYFYPVMRDEYQNIDINNLPETYPM